MTNPNHDPTRSSLDPHLVQLVDTITVGSIDGLHDATAAEVRLRFGETFHDEIQTYAEQQLLAVADRYCNDLNAFVCAGQPDEDHEDITLPLPGYLTEEERLTHMPVVDFITHQNDLDAWLGFASNRNAEQADRTLMRVVMTLQQFHAGSTQRAIDNLESETIQALAQRRMDSQAAAVMDKTVSYIRQHSTNPAIARSLMNTPFAKHYQSFPDELRLRTHLTTLEGHQKTNGEYTEDYQWVLSNIKNVLSNPASKYMPGVAAECLTDITRKTPTEIMDLIENSNDTIIASVQRIAGTEILKMEPQEMTDAHLTLLSQIEADITLSADTYARILYAYKNRGDKIPDHKLITLAERYQESTRRYEASRNKAKGTVATDPSAPVPDTNTAAFICANMPIEQLQATLEDYPILVANRHSSARDIAVYRFAQAGMKIAAQNLVNLIDSSSADPYDQMTRLRNLSMTYEVNGDLDAHAQLVLKARELKLPTAFQQEMRARHFASAYENRQTETARTAFTALARDFSAPNTTIRQAALKLACQTFLDVSNIPAAEDCALRLVKDDTASLEFVEEKQDTDQAFLAVVQAYLKADQHEPAVRLIFSYMAAGRPLNKFVVQAMELTLDPEVIHHVDFHARRLNPLLREEDRIANVV